MDMVERVAEAIAQQMASDDNDNGSIARAAIEAMREPTDRMVYAGDHSGDQYAGDVWQAMIDAALA